MRDINKFYVLILCFSLAFYPVSSCIAAPQNGNVIRGNANIKQAGKKTTINQSSDRAIINWKSFNIAKNEMVQHNMPSSNSAALHRVTGGGGASQIAGTLQSNGNIYLVNPAGVVIHNGARIKTNGFVAASKDIANDNFMKKRLIFDKAGQPDAMIINKGEITVNENGLAALVAPTARNDGVIAAKLGKIALASGNGAWKLDTHGDDLITFTVSETDAEKLRNLDGTPVGKIENNGKIKAAGGIVVLTAAQMDGIVGSVVNNGEISAASAEANGGKVIFKGAGSRVDIANNGKIDVSSSVADGGSALITGDGSVSSSGIIAATGKQKGGKAVLSGRKTALKGNALIDASGASGGGDVLIGGALQGKRFEKQSKITIVEKNVAIKIDAVNSGDGGKAVVWSEGDTIFNGSISARGGKKGGNGGSTETSGKKLKIGDTANIDTSAPQGIHGNWLLDPADFVIAASGGDISGATISANLAKGDMEISTIYSRIAGEGAIYVADAISWDTDATLTLNALGNINIQADITAAGENAGLSILSQNGEFNINGARITLSGANPRLSILGNDYKVITSLRELQNINQDLSGYYALGSDIDASDTKTWNEGKGFDPLGDAPESAIWPAGPDTSSTFTGIFDGLGHTVANLTINRPEEALVGLFGEVYDGAVIKNLNVENANVAGNLFVGILAGLNGYNGSAQGVEKIYSTISNCFTSGIVNGARDIGGLVGDNFGVIENSASEANVYASAGIAGGLVGRNYKNISSSFSAGNVEGLEVLGGFVGSHLAPFSGNALISNCYSTGDVSGRGGSVGGFVGSIEYSGAAIENSYSAGKVQGAKPGGFAGNSYGLCAIINSYWNTSKSGLTNAVGSARQARQTGNGPLNWTASGLTTEEMTEQKYYNGWDFATIWTMLKRGNYPSLKNVATGNAGQSSTENVLGGQPDATPDDIPDKDNTTNIPEYPNNPDLTENTSINASRNSILADNDKEISDLNNVDKNLSQENRNNVYSQQLNNIYNSFDDYFNKALSSQSASKALMDLTDFRSKINNKYILVELISKGSTDIIPLIAGGKFNTIVKDFATDISFWEKIITALVSNICFEISQRYYNSALAVYNSSINPAKLEMLEIAGNLKMMTEFADLGIILSQNIYDEMEENAQFIEQHPVIGTLKNIGELGCQASVGLIEPIADLGLGFNKNISGDWSVWRKSNKLEERIKSLEQANTLLSMKNIGKGLDAAYNVLDTTASTFLTGETIIKLKNASSSQIELYDKVISTINKLPERENNF